MDEGVNIEVWSIEDRLRVLDLVSQGMSAEDARKQVLGGKEIPTIRMGE